MEAKKEISPDPDLRVQSKRKRQKLLFTIIAIRGYNGYCEKVVATKYTLKPAVIYI